jgi:hypothetical protein
MAASSKSPLFINERTADATERVGELCINPDRLVERIDGRIQIALVNERTAEGVVSIAYAGLILIA